MPRHSRHSPRKNPSKARKEVPQGKRPTVTMTTHNPEASKLVGSQERYVILSCRAMRLRSEGYSFRDIAAKLKEEFSLTEDIAVPTVHNWIERAYSEAWKSQPEEAAKHLHMLLDRSTILIKELFPVALAQVKVGRNRIKDGQVVTYIDERSVDEQVKATGEIRKLLEFQARLLDIGKMAGETGPVVNPQNMSATIMQMIQQNIYMPGTVPKEKNVSETLTIEAGDVVIDGMDAS